jgi:hypothetical protein
MRVSYGTNSIISSASSPIFSNRQAWRIEKGPLVTPSSQNDKGDRATFSCQLPNTSTTSHPVENPFIASPVSKRSDSTPRFGSLAILLSVAQFALLCAKYDVNRSLERGEARQYARNRKKLYYKIINQYSEYGRDKYGYRVERTCTERQYVDGNGERRYKEDGIVAGSWYRVRSRR